MSAPVSPSPALAAHREALRDVLAHWPIGSGYYSTSVDLAEAAEMADAVLAYFADPEHGLTVETGADERLRDLTSRLGFGDGVTEPQADNDTIIDFVNEQGREAAEWREHQSWLNDCAAAGCDPLEDCPLHAPACHPAHGLVRDEPSEDERVHLCGKGCRSCAEHDPRDRRDHGHLTREMCPACAPARSDDGRTAVEPDDVLRDLPESFWDVHTWDKTGPSPGSLDVADRKRIVTRILAARLRHDDGEADRG